MKDKLITSYNGNLDIVFIGVGSAFTLEHNQTNFLIVKGEDHILVDFGSTGPKALKDVMGLSCTDIKTILPTHSHNDHVGSIETLALMNRYVGIKNGNSKLKMIINEEYQRELWTHTLQGGLEFNETLDGNRKMQFSDYFDAVRPKWKTYSPRETWELDYGSIHLEMFRTTHIPEQGKSWEASFISYGVFVDNKVFISGDTKFDLDLINIYADKSEIMFHDVQFFPGAVHAPLSNLKELPTEIKNKMYLIHYADTYKNQNIDGFAGWATQGKIYSFKG